MSTDEQYFIDIMKKVSWQYDNMFQSGDKESIMRTVNITDRDADGLVSSGHTSASADVNGLGMYYINPVSQNVEHYFYRIYTKLSCCLGLQPVVVPILKRGTDGTVVKEFITLTANRDECTVNGVDWYDDNATGGSYKTHCHRFFQRLIAFLEKYDPSNDMLETKAGCLANRHIAKLSPELQKVPYLMDIINNNRKCVIPECGSVIGAYLPKNERQSCETTICQQEVNVTDNYAGGDIQVLNTQLSQVCGPESRVLKSLESLSLPTGSPSAPTDDPTTTLPPTDPSVPSTTAGDDDAGDDDAGDDDAGDDDAGDDDEQDEEESGVDAFFKSFLSPDAYLSYLQNKNVILIGIVIVLILILRK